jgi:hypothetical protein
MKPTRRHRPQAATNPPPINIINKNRLKQTLPTPRLTILAFLEIVLLSCFWFLLESHHILMMEITIDGVIKRKVIYIHSAQTFGMLLN